MRLPPVSRKVVFADLYSRAHLYEAALKVYTKPLFQPQKGLATSHDGKTLYEFAMRGPHNLERLHAALSDQRFHFREGIEVRFTRGHRRRRTVYIFPWEERIVDEMLYLALNKALHPILSDHSYAFRHRGFGVDACQHRLARYLRRSECPLYVVKRDVSNYYPSVDQDILLRLLEQWVETDDYLYTLLRERVQFFIRADDGRTVAGSGIPFGTALACLLANVYLTPVDLEMTDVSGLLYCRYADDMLACSPNYDTAREAADRMAELFAQLRLFSKRSHELDGMLGAGCVDHGRFRPIRMFQHLGLEFRGDGTVGLPRVKGRKLRGLFRRAFQRAHADLERIANPLERVVQLIAIAKETIAHGPGSIAIVDYYLKHVDDEKQLELLDRWLAEEVLARAFRSGHSKANFRRLSFARLRRMGLPSLRHRRRLLQHGKIESTFFYYVMSTRHRPEGLAARHSGRVEEERGRLPGRETLSPHLEAAASAIP